MGFCSFSCPSLFACVGAILYHFVRVLSVGWRGVAGSRVPSALAALLGDDGASAQVLVCCSSFLCV
jgi:hypothetical protein